MSKAKSLGDKRGYLLIEAVLAVVILSISLTLIIQSLLTSLRANVASTDYTKAALLADNKFFELMKGRFIAANVREEGRFPEPFAEYMYRIETGSLSETLNEVHLDVLWPAGRKERRFSVSTCLFNPPSP